MVVRFKTIFKKKGLIMGSKIAELLGTPVPAWLVIMLMAVVAAVVAAFA